MPNPFLSGNYAPVADELTVADLPIEGGLPDGLVGTLFRNGPNPRLPPVEPYHWFTGDGMVHAITIERGSASYRNRWVRTERFLAEEHAGRPLFAGFGQPLTEAAERLDTGVANTHVLAHAGRLLALEEAHLPVRLDPASLATVGRENFGSLTGRFTAHPKRDPHTGQLVFFSYSATGPFSAAMSWGTVEADGCVSRHEILTAPYCSMVHDFAVTETRIVLPVLPLTGDLERARSGGPPFAWEPDRGAHLAILDRDRGAASLAWLPCDTCFVFHVMNAFDDGPTIVVDVVEYDEAPLFPHADGTPPRLAGARLARWRIDPARSRPPSRETLDDAPGEFPRIDDRRAGLPNRHGWRVGEADGQEAVLHHDLETGARKAWVPSNGGSPSEAVFVAAGADASEGEGWLLSLIHRPVGNDSVLAILDARAIEDGPVASVLLPRRVPFGFHGSWWPAH